MMVYQRVYARTPEAIAKRFWDLVEIADCWLWTGNTTYSGYGMFYNGSTTVMAHRWAYESLVGAIPEGLEIDHLCRVRNCVNPDHLEPVTRAENMRRGNVLRRKSHCPQGHEYSLANTYVYTKSNGNKTRHCKACVHERTRRVRAKRRSE